MHTKHFLMIVLALSMASCCIYKKYQPQTTAPDNLFGSTDPVLAADTTSTMASLKWSDLFADPILNNLIDSVLANNVDVRTAHLEVQKMQASLTASKLAFLPSISLSPYAQYDWVNPKQTFSYNVNVSAQWQIDIFGQLCTAKRRTEAYANQARDMEQATRVELIATTVMTYYRLLMLDRELAILLKTDTLWQLSLETQRALMEAGQCYSTAVNQLEASLHNVRLQVVDVQRSRRETENAICLLLHTTPHAVERATMDDFTMPGIVGIGVPAALITNRPDVRAAQRQLEAAYYGTRNACAAMFPNITITGNFGLIAFDPIQMAAQAVASLLQPIFAQGALQANLKIAKANQEQARLAFEQRVLQAGTDVNQALTDCYAFGQKQLIYAAQIRALNDAYIGTHELMSQGKATYLEVLVAQENLLAAQLNKAINDYSGVEALVGLYTALGGDSK